MGNGWGIQKILLRGAWGCIDNFNTFNGAYLALRAAYNITCLTNAIAILSPSLRAWVSCGATLCVKRTIITILVNLQVQDSTCSPPDIS